MYKLLVFLIVFSVSGNLYAQEKFEKESRIKSKDIPEKMLSFIDSLNLKTKIKWYLEEGLNKKSFEAKFRNNNVKHSVEFDSLGVIEDLEIEISFAEIESELRKSISSKLQQSCSDYKIRKVQKQFSRSEHDLFALLKNGSIFSNIRKAGYEIVVRCRTQNSVDLYEYLFDDKGNTVSKAKIVFKNSTHLEY